jgi:hypothetical protein
MFVRNVGIYIHAKSQSRGPTSLCLLPSETQTSCSGRFYFLSLRVKQLVLKFLLVSHFWGLWRGKGVGPARNGDTEACDIS